MLSAFQSIVWPRVSFSTMLTVILFHCVSKHAKRIIYIASLCGQFNRYSGRRQVAIGKLNQAMRLAHREEALALPAVVQSKVWQNTGLELIFTEERLITADTVDSIQILARQIVEVSKKWWYGDIDEMTKDVSEMLGRQRLQFLESSLV